MIEKLTELKMVEYDFDKEQIEKLLNWDNYEINIQNSKGFFFASNIENKIYSGIDAARKVYFKDTYIGFPITHTELIIEYYKLSLNNFLKAQKQLLGSIYKEQNEKQNFKFIEIERVENCIQYKTPLAERFNGGHLNHLNIYKGYLSWLINLNEDVLTGEIKPKNEVEKFLTEYKSEFNNETDFNNVVIAICRFLKDEKINFQTPVFVKNGNIKKIAFAMGEIWRSNENKKANEIITYEYLMLYKKLFSIFNNQTVDENKIFSSNLYKYSITKT
jgi:hypothetical protein